MCANDEAGSAGLALLSAGELQVMRRLDEVILQWAGRCDFQEMGYPPLTAVRDLSRIDYFQNFPHLGLAVTPLKREMLSALLEVAFEHRDIAALSLDDAEYFLPSAACYPVYSHMRNQRLGKPQRTTTIQRCFRNERSYERLTRARAFTMRELVFVGSAEDAKAFLAQQKAWIYRFAEAMQIPLSVQQATDPFFQPDIGRAKMQKLFPVKEEFVFEEAVAVSSANSHRNFFGERWNIRLPDGSYAFSACVAFGLERWLYMLARRYDSDSNKILEGLASASGAAMQSLIASSAKC